MLYMFLIYLLHFSFLVVTFWQGLIVALFVSKLWTLFEYIACLESWSIMLVCNDAYLLEKKVQNLGKTIAWGIEGNLVSSQNEDTNPRMI